MSEEEKNIDEQQNSEEQQLSAEEYSLQVFGATESFRGRLHDFVDKPVVVEFKCDGFMKKAIGCLNKVGCDFLEVTGFRRKLAKVEILCCGNNNFDPQRAAKVIIPLDRVCAVEILPTPCPPCD